MTASSPSFHTLLVLGRVSNLPTVWSNCLAAWLLNGGGNPLAFVLLSSGTTLLYLGGMFLNDACDAGFDREFRPERPIPSGKISQRDVWWFGGLGLFLGWTLLFLVGTTVACFALLLVASVIFYDAVHKRTEAAPLLMALCRLLLYLVAGAATLQPIREPVLWHGLALAAYIVGLSCLARAESGQGRGSLFPWYGLLMPLGAIVWGQPQRNGLSWLAVALLALWLGWCARGLWRESKPPMARTVSGLLAGIILVDCATVPHLTVGLGGGFLVLFALARLLQRFIPAT